MKGKQDRFQIRKAAGLYWALDMEQTGEHLCRPIPLNECGAFLFRHYMEGSGPEQMAKLLCREYDISPEQAETDAEAFCRQMEDMHIARE